MNTKLQTRQKRANRIKPKLITSGRPRLIVFRSLKHIYAQIFDDASGKVISAASDLKISKGNNLEKARQVGEEIAKKALEKKVNSVSFDRNGYKYHGRVKQVAEAAREAGLNF